MHHEKCKYGTLRCGLLQRKGPDVLHRAVHSPPCAKETGLGGEFEVPTCGDSRRRVGSFGAGRVRGGNRNTVFASSAMRDHVSMETPRTRRDAGRSRRRFSETQRQLRRPPFFHRCAHPCRSAPVRPAGRRPWEPGRGPHPGHTPEAVFTRGVALRDPKGQISERASLSFLFTAEPDRKCLL